MPTETVLSRVSSIAALVRDVGVILGIPVVLTVGIRLYDLQTKALEAQMKAIEAQNEVLKQTQYDRALSMIKSQKELFDNERASLERKIGDLSTSGKDQTEEIAKLQSRVAELDLFKRGVDEQASTLSGMLQMMMIQMAKDAKDKTFTPPPAPSPPPKDSPKKVYVRVKPAESPEPTSTPPPTDNGQNRAKGD